MAKVHQIRELSPVAKRLAAIRDKAFLFIITGDYKGFKAGQNEYAKLAVKNKEAIKELPRSKKSVPMFSREGLNFMKIWFLNLFRRKSPEEKELIAWAGKERLAQRYNIYRSA